VFSERVLEPELILFEVNILLPGTPTDSWESRSEQETEWRIEPRLLINWDELLML
jgi:hypothetical protein